MKILNRYTTIKDTRIHFLEMGRGKPLLFIHGHRADARRVLPILKRFARKYHVFAPDLPGFGCSDELSRWHSLETYIPYLAGFVERLQLKNYILGGISMGGTLAVELALQKTKEIKKIVLVGTIINWRRLKLRKLKYVLAVFLLALFPRSHLLRRFFDEIINSDRIFKRLLRFQFPKQLQQEEVINYELRQWRVMSIKVWAQTLYSLLRFNLKTNKRLSIPALLIYSEDDQYIDIKNAINDLRKIFLETETIIVPNLPHVPVGEISGKELDELEYIFKKI